MRKYLIHPFDIPYLMVTGFAANQNRFKLSNRKCNYGLTILSASGADTAYQNNCICLLLAPPSKAAVNLPELPALRAQHERTSCQN
jgi:hypothetical protein